MSASTSTKRVSSLPKPPTDLSSTVVIADSAVLTGKKLVTIRSSTIIHPKVTISSIYSHVTIGNTCIIGERSTIGLNADTLDQPEGVVIEDHVVVHPNVSIESRRIGAGSRIEVGAVLGKGSVIGKNCMIGSLCRIESNEIVPDDTVVYGHGLRRLNASKTSHMKGAARQTEVLRELVSGNVAKWS